MNTTTSDYTAIAWNEAHHYRLADDELGYRFSNSDASFTVELRPGSFSLHPRRQTHRYFRAGLVLIIVPLVTLGVICAKERSIGGLDLMLYVHIGLFALGLVLAVRFRRIYRAYMLRTSSGDQLLIYRDPDNAESADDFISRLKEMAEPDAGGNAASPRASA